VPLAVLAQRFVDPVRDPQQGELPQRREVADAEVVAEGDIDLVGGIDVAVRHASPQRLRRAVDQLDLVGGTNDGVGNRLALRDAGDALDDVVQRLQVLDVERRDDGDAGVEKDLDVLPAFLMPAARHVRVREFVDERHLRRTGDDRVHVHLLEALTAVLEDLPWDHFEVAHLGGGLGAAVRLDIADDDVGASFLPAPTLVEHRERLADARCSTEVDAQDAASHPLPRSADRGRGSARAR
jgi:hypothetical protein